MREDAPHAAACALYIIRAGVLARLDEAGQRSLLSRLLRLLPNDGGNSSSDEINSVGGGVGGGGGGGGEKVESAKKKPPPPPSVVLHAVGDVLGVLGRVTEKVRAEAAEALTGALITTGSTERSSGGGGRESGGVAEAALAIRSLAAAAPESAASLLEDAVSKMQRQRQLQQQTAATSSGGNNDSEDVGAVIGAAAAAAALVSAGDVFELGLPSGLLRDAAEAGRALTTTTTRQDGVVLSAADGARVRERGWGVVAAAIAGPTGVAEVEENGDTIAADLARAFDPKALASAAAVAAPAPAPPVAIKTSVLIL